MLAAQLFQRCKRAPNTKQGQKQHQSTSRCTGTRLFHHPHLCLVSDVPRQGHAGQREAKYNPLLRTRKDLRWDDWL